MNLHSIISGAIGSINPRTYGTVQISLGSAQGTDFRRTPTYSSPIGAKMQIQELTAKDLAQLDGLDIQGSQRAIYISGQLNGLVRAENKGGDLLTIRGQVWLVTAVLEQWPNWVKVAVTLQNGS